MYLQILDVSVFSIFKKHYNDVSEEYLDVHGPRGQIKLTASQSRILCTRLTVAAWKRTINSVNFKQEFGHLGYTWIDDSPVSPRTLPGYSFDPTTVVFSSTRFDEEDEENQIEILAQTVHTTKTTVRPNTQATLDRFWKK